MKFGVKYKVIKYNLILKCFNKLKILKIHYYLTIKCQIVFFNFFYFFPKEMNKII